jgi:hypothetical protein
MYDCFNEGSSSENCWIIVLGLFLSDVVRHTKQEKRLSLGGEYVAQTLSDHTAKKIAAHGLLL